MTEPAPHPGEDRPDLASLVATVSHLFTPPEILIRLRHAVDDTHSTIETVSAIIMQDPHLSARILRMANSSLYGYRKHVDTVSRAVTLIGLRDLLNVTMAVFIAQSLGGLRPTHPEPAVFWRHSVFTGLLACLLARRRGGLHPERLFVAGLLHDIGALILHARLPQLLGDTWQIAEGSEQRLADYERNLLGYDHGEVGGALFHQWELPETLQLAIAHHHSESAPTLDGTFVMLADCLANTLAECALTGTPSGLPDDRVWEEAGLSPGMAVDIIEESEKGFVEAMSLLVPG